MAGFQATPEVDEFWDHYNTIKTTTSDGDQTSKILLDPDELSDTFEKAKVSAKSRNTLFSEFLKLHGGNRIANSSRQKGKRHLDNAHLAILAGTTVKKYPDLWTGTGGGGDGLQSRFTIIATNKGAMPIQQRPTAGSSAFEACVRIAKQVSQPGQLITYSAPAWKAMNDWSKAIDLDSDAAARVSDMVHQLMIIMSVTNDLAEVPVSLMEQGLAWGDYEIAVRKRLNPEDSWTWVQSQENAIMAYYKRCRDWGDKAPKSMNDVRRAIHPQRKPGGLGPFLQAWKNLIGTGVLKLRNKGHKTLRYGIFA